MNLTLLRRVLWTRGLRAFADGYVSLMLPLYLISLGMGPFQVGVIATATLLGSGICTLLVGLYAWRFQYRSLLLMAALLMAATGLGFAAITNFWPLLIVAAVGTLNPSSGDVSVFLPLEHALISQSVNDNERTAVFARYSLVGALLAALGALFAAVPDYLVISHEVDRKVVMQLMFILYGIIGLVCGFIYRSVPHRVELEGRAQPAPLRKSKRIVYILAALFSLDAFGGGFVVQSLVALWLFQKFELSTVVAGTIFFWTGVLSAFSYLVAARISNRIGLVNTMVFTHLPANILLVLVPFMPTLEWAIALLLVRSALSQMDVPTRSSYVMAVVNPEERAAAASVTAVPRSLASAVSPMLAGYLLGVSVFGWPLVIAGGLKIIYDLLLLTTCRRFPPPEDASTRS
ncbi:MFS transporter [Herbaspirillum sp. GCM10030257]|uniref:MFS transporter n=1 Tax=Herbaspirillum sp. GCM10030257 TaxID=3273393 RepID=UPI003611A258